MKHPIDKLHRRKIGIKKAKKMKHEIELSEKMFGEPVSKKVKGMWKDTRKICSNPFCCGNPRRIRGTKRPTLSEQLALEEIEKYEQYYEELD